MPDDAKPQTPIDLTLDFESFATTPTTHPPGDPPKPIDLNWDEPPLPTTGPTPPKPVPTVAPRPAAVEALPEAVPVPVPVSVPVVVPRASRPAPAVVPPVRGVDPRKGKPAARRNVQAVVVVLTLTLATAAALLVLLYALYVGFKAVGTPKPTQTTTRRAV